MTTILKEVQLKPMGMLTQHVLAMNAKSSLGVSVRAVM